MKNTHQGGFVSLLAIAVMLLGVILATYLIQQKIHFFSQAVSAPSPLIFGTNLTLTDSSDQFLTSSITRQELQSLHVQMIRMPIRSVGCPSTAEVQAAQDIHNSGMVPLIIFKFSQTDPVSADKCVMQQINPIFSNASPVYYEFGNERDLAGVDQTTYTNTWNQVVPQIKGLYSNAKFGGPVNFQYNPTYVSYFVHNANPKPDFISWHEYTCGNSNTAQYCIDHIANWSTHISATKTAIQNYGDAVPPIMITEWNYDPNNPNPDPRATAQFQQTFTQTALNELAKDGVFAATHYVSTGHQYYNLIDPGDVITPEGQMFGQMYVTLMSGSNTLPTPTTAPTATPIPVLSGSGATPTPTPSATKSVASFTLLNAQNNTGVMPLSNGTVVNLSNLPANCLNIRANTNPATVGSVKFGYDGNSSYRVENIVPYDLAGDTSDPNIPNCWTLTAGSHVITATPYSSSGASGTIGTPLTVSFTAITSTPTPTSIPPTLTPQPTIAPTVAPTTPPVSSGALKVNIPSCISSGYGGSVINISWGDSTVSWVDISADSGFSSFYNKSVSGVLSTTAPSGFNGYSPISGALTLNPNTTYYVRTWNNSVHSPSVSFSIPGCNAFIMPTPTPSLTMSVLAQDTFARTNQTYWGTASDGNIWGGDANSNKIFSVYTDTGKLSGGWQPYSAILGPIAANQQVLFAGSINNYKYTNIGAVVRWIDNNNWYKSYIDGNQLVIQKDVAGNVKTLANTGFKAYAGISYTMRFQASGSTLSVKVWPSGTAEPIGWMLTASDNSLTSGRGGLRAQLQTGAVITYQWFSALQLP